MCVALSLTVVAACDADTDSSTLRSHLAEALGEAGINLTEAIAIAEQEVPGATVYEASFSVTKASSKSKPTARVRS